MKSLNLIIFFLQDIPSSSRSNPFMHQPDIMSTSYSEISGNDLLERNYDDMMDVSEDILEEDNDRDRPDSFYPLLENEGLRKLFEY